MGDVIGQSVRDGQTTHAQNRQSQGSAQPSGRLERTLDFSEELEIHGNSADSVRQDRTGDPGSMESVKL